MSVDFTKPLRLKDHIGNPTVTVLDISFAAPAHRPEFTVIVKVKFGGNDALFYADPQGRMIWASSSSAIDAGMKLENVPTRFRFETQTCHSFRDAADINTAVSNFLHLNPHVTSFKVSPV